MTIPENWPPQLPPRFYDGLEQMNQGEYFLCHETLEALWIPEKRGVRELYQGVIQIAVGCFHLTVRANWIGAVNKLDAGARRIERTGIGMMPVLDFYGVAWTLLIADADRLQTHLRALGRDNVSTFHPSLLPQVHYTRPA